jgi:pyridoxal phosphate enzyme (YggS family)
MSLSQDPQSRLDAILARIEAARKRSVKPAPFTHLIAVSKTHGEAEIEALIMAGQRRFGENRVQEAKTKFAALNPRDRGLELHLIGPLQTNKVRDAVALFDYVHSLDRPKLAHALASERDATGRCPSLFVQVNTGEEAQKSGVAPSLAGELVRLARDELRLPVIGLMCIPPAHEVAAPHFALLASLARELALDGLSMGMSADFETAIAFGATHVRVGSALFGARH